ncbi:MAG: winged helix-turn-helix transcriptional regulator [Candidatus Thorarchaeota archaeon]
MQIPKRSKQDVENCPVFIASNILGKRWTLLILQTLMTHEAAEGLRFGQIQSHLDWVSPKVLTQRLRELEHEMIITREVDASSIPAKVSYSLTNKGQDLRGIIQLMQNWGRKYGGDATAGCLGEDLEHCQSCPEDA